MADQQQFAIQRIFIKDASFEAPSTPEVFQQEWKPELNLDIDTRTNALGDDHHEVVLHITVTVKSDGKTAFIAEVQQSGIFGIIGFGDEELKPMLGSFCPNILYPYAREMVSDLVNRASFPPLYLAPVNFDALYAERQEKEKESAH